MKYQIFIRDWWKISSDPKDQYTGEDETLKKLSGLTPNPNARKTKVKQVDTPEQARKWCEEYNETHPAGKLSRKAEWESVQ
jgi:hypothetical protein